jgi:ABC-type branched-subunit amino acid transport system ATPase component/MFS family permease
VRTDADDELYDEVAEHATHVEPIAPEAVAPDKVQGGNAVTRVLRTFWSDLRAFGQLRRTPYGLAPAMIFALIAFVQRFDTQAFNVAGPDIVRALGIRIASIISIQQIIGVILAVAAIVIGWWADRHRRVPLFAVGTAVAGVGAVLTSRATSTVSLGVPQVFDNAANEVANVPSYSLLADYYPPEVRGRMFAFLNTMLRVAGLLAILAVGPMIRYWGFRTTFVITGVPIIVMGLVALVRLREPVRGYFERREAGSTDDAARHEDEPQSLGEGWRATFAVRTLRRFFVADIIISMGFVGSSFFLPFFLAERYGLDAIQRSYLFLPATVCALYGGVRGGNLVDRLSARRPERMLLVFGVFSMVAGLGTLGYAFKPPIPLLIAFTCITGFGSALVGPAVAAVYSQVIPSAIRTQGLQVIGLAALPGTVFGLQFAKQLFGSYGYQTVFLYSAPFFFIGGLVQMTAAGFFDLDRRNAIAQALAAEEWRQARAAGNDKLLVCRGVDSAYDGVQVLFGVDFDVEENEIIALLGTNGAGKSTLLKAISGSQEASGGGIVFDGRDITHMPPHEIAARRIVHMPGGRGVFPSLSVLENLTLANWLSDDDEANAAGLREVLEIFPVLRERIDEQAGTLSGGEQQMLSLAQAFLMKPRLLMIDELSLGLSPAVVGQLLDVVREIHKRGVTIIVVEQSVNVALNIAQRAIFMEKGEVKFFGRTADLLSRPDILRAVYVKGTGALTDGAPAGAMRGERQRRALEIESARPALEVTNVSKAYGGVVAVDDVSFQLREGEVLGVIGPNGSGKTTLFDLISGFQPADGGQVVLAGVDVTRWTPEARVRAGLIRRFQDARLFPSLTVEETLLIALEQRLEVKSTILNALSAPPARRAERRLRARADRLVELLSLESYRDKFIKELSTGLRRIVDLACVLAAEPKVLLLDEPSSGIAQAEAEGLAPLLRRVRFETGCSIAIIEHDMPLISAVSDELIALDQGQVVLRGSPEEVLNDERVIQSYLGGSEAAIRRSGRLS